MINDLKSIAEPNKCKAPNLLPEAVITKDNLLIVGCQRGCVEITELQVEGKKRMNSTAFNQGQVGKKIQFI